MINERVLPEDWKKILEKARTADFVEIVCFDNVDSDHQVNSILEVGTHYRAVIDGDSLDIYGMQGALIRRNLIWQSFDGDEYCRWRFFKLADKSLNHEDKAKEEEEKFIQELNAMGTDQLLEKYRQSKLVIKFAKSIIDARLKEILS